MWWCKPSSNLSLKGEEKEISNESSCKEELERFRGSK